MHTPVLIEQFVACLECDRRIRVTKKAELDDMVTCGHCGTRYVIIDLDPAEIDYINDDWNEEDWGDIDDWLDDED